MTEMRTPRTIELSGKTTSVFVDERGFASAADILKAALDQGTIKPGRNLKYFAVVRRSDGLEWEYGDAVPLDGAGQFSVRGAHGLYD